MFVLKNCGNKHFNWKKMILEVTVNPAIIFWIIEKLYFDNLETLI